MLSIIIPSPHIGDSDVVFAMSINNEKVIKMTVLELGWGYNPAFILLGATPAASTRNIQQWLDGLVAQFSGPGSLVQWEGRRVPSLF